ncbi:GNAT family N-acetyltransferase [Gluconacetobacter takamatsuzukensis]|uniref:N-acetyltransferase n=1 Tax=Gluconacetobacter takamatsuzukensis TaxID=1286190 RepID=A0A7W4KBC3_9PROT|nr:GNAT family N-acetyltransferase [Gluconacetobacter takamatsuzukensis]MBB2203806.1 N-acetyltransferase [Gluconacetobacter takamatsuzukensis]
MPPPSPAVTTRTAHNADLPAITAIYAHHVLHGCASFEIEAPSVDEMARRMEALRAKHFPYLVAEQDGAVIGYAYAGPYHPRIAYRDTVEDSIYLAQESTGRGVGSMLLGALMADCVGRGFRQMMALVGDSANMPSIRLHERHGFRTVGTLQSVGYKFGRWLDVVLLQCELGSGDRTPPDRP